MFILDRARTVPEELMEKIHILEQKLDSCTLERNNLENQLGHVSEDKTNWTQKFEAQDQECNKLREEISNLNVKIQESAEIKQEHEKDKDKFKVKIPKFKLDDKEKKKWKENQKQQQIIQDHLIEELKTTTGILNDTLQLKATLQAENSSLQNTISILEKKITSYQENSNINEKDILCSLVPSVIDLVVKFILERRKLDHYKKLLHPQLYPESPKSPKSPKDKDNHAKDKDNHVTQDPLSSPIESSVRVNNHLNGKNSDTKHDANPFDGGNPF